MKNSSLRERTLLLVEDDYDIRTMLVMLLDMEGYRVVRSANGREALGELLGGLHPDLILLDLMMPVMSGWQLLDIMERDPVLAAIPVIVISGDGRSAAQHVADRVSCFLKKPLDLDELLSKIEEFALDAPQPDEEAAAVHEQRSIGS